MSTLQNTNLSRVLKIATDPRASTTINISSNWQLRQGIGKKMIVKPQFEKIVEGESILLIDDILTTGLTALAGVKALKEAKVREVYAACLGWTVDMDNYSQR